MSGRLGLELLIIFLLMVANGFFAASEIATVSARRGRLQQQAQAGKQRARQALELAEEPDRFLATVQVGITLISTLAAAFSGASLSGPLADWLRTLPVVGAYADSLALAIDVLLITYFTLVIGELAPKRLALQHAESVASAAAPIMTLLSRLARPIVGLLTLSTNLLLRLLGQRTEAQPEVTEEDIVYLTHEGFTSGAVEREEEEFIRRVLHFADRTVREVMRPRSEVVAIEASASLEEVARVFRESGYSRLPVYRDTIDNVLGILHAKDLLYMLTGSTSRDYLRLLRTPIFALEQQHLDDLLRRFKRERAQIAIVIDEYSQMSGLVTMEDLLEELVGEIQDEYDVDEERSVVQREDGSWLVDGLESYETVREQIGLPPIPEEERGLYSSIAGLVQAHLDRIPHEGDRLTLGNFELEVIDMDGRRVDKVLIHQRQPDEQAHPDEQETSA
ncbi:hemolysin family protein [Thermogemmatispora carboxidivorans]|uniref:hemolysin family protein n=1 Tax=Thermogemmatispora carboxidivorans TaxID=1382306 RepID=UPI00069A4BB9|nr:hemolysin family protein [Thermogemmatispora carboxidivorans]